LELEEVDYPLAIHAFVVCTCDRKISCSSEEAANMAVLSTIKTHDLAMAMPLLPASTEERTIYITYPIQLQVLPTQNPE